jgi:hypothetical protein
VSGAGAISKAEGCPLPEPATCPARSLCLPPCRLGQHLGQDGCQLALRGAVHMVACGAPRAAQQSFLSMLPSTRVISARQAVPSSVRHAPPHVSLSLLQLRSKPCRNTRHLRLKVLSLNGKITIKWEH